MDNKSVIEFYRNKKVFITGATGFLGKVLLEKLLRTCPVDSIYLLIRPKKGVNASERLREILQNPLLDAIKKSQPYVCEKIKIVDGDIALPYFGLSQTDRMFIKENINIVFHSAATVRFDENLKQSVTLNTVATKTILEMCLEMKQLESFVYVSTAYSHSYRKHIKETVYKIIPEPEDIIRSQEILPQEALDAFESNILKAHANTYSYTKALAENIVLNYSNKLPVAIVRPSIVASIWKDPTPGWIEGYSGATGLTIGCGYGMINTLLCDEKYIIDLIPVDIVINTLITAAWHTVAYRTESLRVYNCVSGSSNGLCYGKFGMLIKKWWKLYPSKHILWYPRFVFRTTKFIHNICCFWYHTVPAAFMDLWLIYTRQKPVMLKRSKKCRGVLDALTFFMTHDWDFETSTTKSLAAHVKDTTDSHLFPMDVSPMSGFDWDDYVRNYILGIRKYVLKDDLDSLPEAKAKLNRLYWLQKVFQVSSMFVVASFAAKAVTVLLPFGGLVSK